MPDEGYVGTIAIGCRHTEPEVDLAARVLAHLVTVAPVEELVVTWSVAARAYYTEWAEDDLFQS